MTTQIVQVAYVVKSIERTARYWREILGIAPCFVWDIRLVEPRYRGQETGISKTLGFCFSNNMSFEFIEQHNDVPSVYREVKGDNDQLFHHWGIMSDSFDEDIKAHEEKGYELAYIGTVPGMTRFAYMDTVVALGGFTELIEDTPEVNRFFGDLMEQAANWDGGEPLIKVAND